jgi:PAS domain S-box-containing protein
MVFMFEALRRLIPKALSSPRDLEEINRELQKQVAERDRAVEELKQSEEQFRLLVEGVQDYAIYMLDPKGGVITWNAGAQRIKGYRAEEIVGKHFSCFYSVGDLQTGKPNQALETAAAKGRYEEESLRVRKDGSEFLASVVITALRDASGQLRGFAKVVRDITERKETEQRLRESERLAALGTTAAVFAHEIGNPLNGLSTSLQIVTQLIRNSDNLDPLVGDTIGIAHQEIQRLTSLLKDYRSFAGPQRVNIQPNNLKQIVEEVLAPLAKHYRDSGVTLKFEFDGSLPLVPVDREKMKQVVLNLCKNACEAMPEGGTLTCRAYPASGSAILEVADTGMGIPEGLNAFQLFKTTKAHGTGLGLPIVEQIISEHRGTIKYVSEIGKGTTFIVSLPLPSSGELSEKV